MKVFVVSANRLIRYLIPILIIATVIVIVFVIGPQVMPVSGQNKELPIYSVDTGEKKVAITFDCAWGAKDIPDILTTLKENNIKATFFVVGKWAEKFPSEVKAISDDGHDIANHSDSHARMGLLGRDSIAKELKQCSEKLEAITKKKVDLFRPPYGEYNDAVINTAKDLGYYTIQWDVDSLDWKPGIDKNEILSRVSNKVRNGSIILFHNDTKYTAEILPSIISTLRSKGYSFEPVSKLIYRDNYYIDYDGRQKRK